MYSFAGIATSIMGNYTGSTTYKMNKNAAETENRGIELALNTRNIVKKDLLGAQQ